MMADEASWPLFNIHHVKMMKVALAIAIIRQKPKGITAREFTRKLSLQFTQIQTNWKQKADQLSHELLMLKQEFVRYKLTGYGHSMELSSDIYCEQSSKEIDIHSTYHKTDTSLQTHIKFIKYVSILKLTAQPANLSSDTLSTVKDSIIFALNGITEIILSDYLNLPLSSEMLTSAMDSMLGILKSEWMCHYVVDILESCRSLHRACMSKLCDDSVNTHTESFLTLQILISKLSSLEELHSKTIVLMVDYICQRIQEFEKTMSDIILLDIDMINSFGAVLICMETVLTEQNHAIPITALRQLSETVENTTLDISGIFPLVGFAVWRLYGIMRSKVQQHH